MAGTSTLRETLGSDVLVHFNVHGGRPLASEVRSIAHDVEDPVELETVDRALSFIGRFSPRSGVRTQDELEVAVQPGSIQIFDRTDGRSLRDSARGGREVA
jgi:hypothetical protein